MTSWRFSIAFRKHGSGSNSAPVHSLEIEHRCRATRNRLQAQQATPNYLHCSIRAPILLQCNFGQQAAAFIAATDPDGHYSQDFSLYSIKPHAGSLQMSSLGNNTNPPDGGSLRKTSATCN